MVDLDYARVIGRFGLTVGDTGSDPDDSPDTVWCDAGRVFLTPLNTFVKVAGGTPVPWTGGNAVIECAIDANGYLTYTPPGGTVTQFVDVVDLTSTKVNPQVGADAATHRVTFSEVKSGTTAVDFPVFTCRLTAAGDGTSGAGINDLTIVAPILPGEASPITRGEQGVSVQTMTVNGLGELEVTLDDATVVNAGALPVGPGGSDAGVAGYVGTPASATAVELGTAAGDSGHPLGAQLLASTVGKATELAGGQVPEPIRVPHLTIDEAYPRPGANLSVLWVDGATMYGQAEDRGFYKSTDYGRNWTYVSRPATVVGYQGTFLRLANGYLLGYVPVTTTPQIVRSTDDGVTWTVVHTLRADTQIMGPTSWCVDGNGHIFYSEYQTADTFAAINIYRSTDNGATFSVYASLPGPTSGSADKVRHCHGVQYDSVSGRVYIAFGDTEAATGIYRTNAANDGVEVVVTNARLASLGPNLARAIGMMFFPTHIAWMNDDAQSPYIVRMARTEIGSATPVAEKVYRINADGWFTCRASSDGTVWLGSASHNGGSTVRLDDTLHLYAIEDNGARVYEVGSVPQGNTSPSGAIAPVGQPQMHTDRVWLQSYQNYAEGGAAIAYQFSARLSRGVRSLFNNPPRKPRILAWQSANVRTTLAVSAAAVAFAETRVASTRPRLVIHDYCIRRLTGSGAAYLEIWNIGTATRIWQSPLSTTTSSARSTAGLDEADWIVALDLTAAGTSALEFRVAEGGSGFDGIVSVTYAVTY